MTRHLLGCARRMAFCAFAAVIATTIQASIVSAAVINGFSSDGHPISAEANFSSVGDLLTVELKNTTTSTLDAGELFTGLEFSVVGTPTLLTKTAALRTIESDGTFSDTAPGQDLSWSLSSLGGDMWRLDFSPNAQHAIVGPPIALSYAGANPSVRGNPGHNPFAAEMAIFTLNVPGLGAVMGPTVVVKTFLFGTGPDPATEVPEPASWLLVMAGVLLLPWRRR